MIISLLIEVTHYILSMVGKAKSCTQKVLCAAAVVF